MFRLIRLILLLVVIAAVVVGTYLYVARVPTLERYLSKNLGVPVKIEEVNLGLNDITVQGLQIKDSLTLKSLTIHMPLYEALKKTIHIKEIRIDAPTIDVQLLNSTGTDNNWARLINNLPTTETKTERRYQIDSLKINNLAFNITRANGKKISVPPLAALQFNNIGTDTPLTLSQVGKVLFESILRTLTSKSNLSKILENVAPLPLEWIKGVQSNAPLEEARGALEEGIETLKKKGKEAGDLIQDLFSK